MSFSHAGERRVPLRAAASASGGMMHALVGEGGEAGATSTAAAATADGIMHVDSPDVHSPDVQSAGRPIHGYCRARG